MSIVTIDNLYLKKGKEKSLNRLHPWVFSGALQSVPSTCKEGDMVKLFDSENNFIAFGHYQNSSLAIRIFTFIEEDINQDCRQKRMSQAINI
jgi:23S rRNA (cytosine1962-C5)-methyltransferase